MVDIPRTIFSGQKFNVHFLLFAPAAIAELLSGSAPPVEFFNPGGFVVLNLLYGCGALLIREMKARRQLGWVSVALLAAAYGIIEEGLCCKSFFDPAWGDLGAAATYARWLDTAWLWTVFLIYYHALISISVPIILSDLVFPDLADTPLLAKSGLALASIGFLSAVIYGFLNFPTIENRFIPEGFQVVCTIFVIIAFIQIALNLHPRGKFVLKFTIRNRLRPTFLGFIVIALPMVAFYRIASSRIAHPVGLTFLILALIISLALITGRFNEQTSKYEKFGFVFGVLLFFILIAPIQEIQNASRLDNTTGMTGVGFLALVLLLILRFILFGKKS